MSEKRLRKELANLRGNPSQDFSAGPLDETDLTSWSAWIIGPAESPYDGGLFYLSLHFPVDYPYKPPKIAFTTKVYHPNIAANGNISLDVLGDHWGSGLTLKTVLLSISSLLKTPNLDESLEPEIARMYKTNRNQYEATAREWTTKFACVRD